MRYRFSFTLFLLIFGFSAFCFAADIKEPSVAGKFYPDKAEELSRMIDVFFALAKPAPVEGEIFVLVSPHAGYGFSGEVAAYGYRLIKDKPYKTVVVIGPSHYYGFTGVSVYPRGIFKTPLGNVEVDSEFTQTLLNKDEDIFFQEAAFLEEHSIEVQVPFLQKVLSGFKIVPVVMGDCNFAICQKLAGLLTEAIGKRRDVLIVVSTDMYHGYDYQEAEAVDAITLDSIKKMDAEALYNGLREGKMQLCGGFPLVTALLTAKELGHNKVEVLRHTNSALVTGKKRKGVWTVGYASCVIDATKASSVNAEPAGSLRPLRANTEPAEAKRRRGSGTGEGEVKMMNETQRKRLLEIARNAIETYLRTGKELEIAEQDRLLTQEMGAFVTLHKAGELRGCIGNLVGRGPLYQTVRDMAIEAAVHDWRFSPVRLSELKDIEIEISVLSPLKKIESTDEIQLGTHGVLISRGSHGGVFLPQVATETGWSKEEFLSNLCSHKAQLPADAWKDKNTDIFIFTAEVFSEKEIPPHD